MTPTSHEVPIGIAGARVPEGIHLCYIHNDDDERGRTTAKFVEQGLAEKARILCLVDAVAPHDIRGYLRELGVDLSEREDALAIGNAEDAYCPSGLLSPDTLLGNLSAFCRQAVSEGYSGARITGDMGWVLRRETGMASVMEYEVKATDTASTERVVAVCEYDPHEFLARYSARGGGSRVA